MKSMKLVALLIFSLAAQNILADENPRKTVEISINPLSLINGTLPVTVRVALTQKIALGVFAYGRFLSWGEGRIHGGGGGISTKFFLTGSAISDSWFVEPGISAGYTNHGQGFWGLYPSILAGHTWVWNSGFTLNLGLGLSYGFTFVDKDFWLNKTAFGIHGIMPTGEFSLGWAF